VWIILKSAVEGYIAHGALSRGAAIAFYVVTSLAPVLLIVVAPWHCRWFRNPVLRALNRNEVRAVRADPFEVLEIPQSLDGSAFAAPPRQATLPSNSSASK